MAGFISFFALFLSKFYDVNNNSSHYDIPDPQAGMRPRAPNFYFPDTAFHDIRRRLLRLAHNLGEYRTVDALYEEILASFTSFGVERNRANHQDFPDLPWTSFLGDHEREVDIQSASAMILSIYFTYFLYLSYFSFSRIPETSQYILGLEVHRGSNFHRTA